MFKKILATCLSFIFVGFLFNSSATAEEITISISGNGGGSDNSAQVTTNTTTTVTQTNNADINNDVSGSADTGSNQTSSNNGDASITTGDATSTTSINNQGINANIAENCDCPGGSSMSLSISGNGSGSINDIDLTSGNNTNAYQSNSAQITNNVVNSPRTGYNTANNNNGDVAIITGDAWAETLIKNKNINFSSAVLGNFDNSLSVLISGNADGSINLVKLLFDNSINSESRNFSVIFNNVTNSANTGGNVANSNNGAVLIATGDAVSVVNIANENINGSFAELCGCKITPPVIPPPGGGDPIIPPPVNSPSNGGNGGSTSIQNAAGQVLGAAIGTILPATGGYFLLLMTIFCLTLFLVGGYLRFGSGISPPIAYA